MSPGNFMDFAGHIEGTKKPAGLAPCGLSGLHQTQSLHTFQEHLSSSAESLFILLNNDFSLRFPTPVRQISLCTFSDQTPV